MLQHNLYFIYLKRNKKQNKTQLSLLSQKDLDSGILTSAVLSFTLVHSSCAAIPFLTEHVPPWPCAAWHAALKEGRHVLVWLHEAVLMILWLEADLGTSFLGPSVHACTNCHLSYVDKWSRTNPWNWKPHCCARFIPFSYHVLCFKPPLFTSESLRNSVDMKQWQAAAWTPPFTSLQRCIAPRRLGWSSAFSESNFLQGRFLGRKCCRRLCSLESNLRINRSGLCWSHMRHQCYVFVLSLHSSPFTNPKHFLWIISTALISSLCKGAWSLHWYF